MSIDSPVADDLIDGPQQSATPAHLASGVSLGLLRGVSPVLFCAATLLTGVSVAAAVAQCRQVDDGAANPLGQRLVQPFA